MITKCIFLEKPQHIFSKIANLAMFEVDGRSMQCWRMNLDRRPESRPVRLLELTLPRPERPAVYRVVVGRFTVEVGDDFSELTLGRLLDLVAAC